ncbi:GNAT family N-acetyltransferase [Streptomyces sp. XM4193]|uniref:GNAT family N-acetyltransferase n=1 Tax=Streptomyces sp. XM4193 TaxID=2929782 RepID=UPI001FFB3923|nr:GNAT family N-acetyltransferase [Streptomyces sp. XM4193]MCK1798203.1 GNAT family N-acetyltransferase [Streptomyces sp. XM4193]
MPRDEITLRTLSDPAQLPDWFNAVAAGFLLPRPMDRQEREARGGPVVLDRLQGAYDGDRCVATFRTFPQEVTVPGGARVPSCAATSVTVQPTHRRRGLLGGMMKRALDAAKERGELCSTLIAAEQPIYGRFGYGPAAWSADFEVDLTRAGLDRNRPADTGDGRIILVTPEEMREAGPKLHDRVRALPRHAGHIDRTAHYWQLATGGLRYPDDGFQERFNALYLDSAEQVQGLALYRVESRWENGAPCGTVEVPRLQAATPEAERALWDHLFRVDWTTSLRAPQRAPDDVLQLLLPDGRAARTTECADFLWLRPLDTPALLTRRTYPTAGSLVLEVRDRAGYAAGRWRLDASPEGSTCTPTTESAELTLPVEQLGALYLGDESASRAHWLGRIDEHRAGAVQLADTLLHTPRRPWCPDSF